jgi:hypothetical protein
MRSVLLTIKLPCVCRKPRPLDLTRESIDVGRDGCADLPALEPGCSSFFKSKIRLEAEMLR